MKSEIAERIIEDYTAGEKYSNIQKAYDVTRIQINELLLEYGIPRRGTQHKPTGKCILPEDARQCLIGLSGRCDKCGWNDKIHQARVLYLQFKEREARENAERQQMQEV